MQFNREALSYCDRYTAWRDTAPLAAQSEDLRPYWRGTSGRSKEDQASFFVACGGGARGDIEDIVA